MTHTILNRDDLIRDGDSYEYEGYHASANVSILLIDVALGDGPRLHSHPYEEVFIVHEGTATYTVGTATLEVVAGQIVIVPAGTPHKFVNSGSGRLRQTDIHVNPKFITDWLED